MDELDQKILHELQIHGIQKSEILASRIGIGGRAIRNRLSRMKKDGVFRTVILPNHVLLGHRAWARIGIKAIPRYLTEVANFLIDNPIIYSVACSFGRFDFIIDVHLETFEELAHFVNGELSLVTGIQNLETMILMTPRKYYDYLWAEPKFNQKCKYCHNTIIRKNVVDDTDRKIISILQRDGLVTPAHLKIELQMSEITIRKRINEMLANGVFKINVIPDPSISRFELAATIGVIVNKRLPHEIIDKIIDAPEVTLASTSLGRFTIILSTRFRSIESFNKYINDDLSQIEGISYVESFILTKLIKLYNTRWPDSVRETPVESV